MVSFEERRQEYFNGIYCEFDKDILNNQKEEIRELINNPKSEKEIMFAESFIRMTKTIERFYDAFLCGNIKPFDIETNIFLNWIIKLINALHLEDYEVINKLFKNNPNAKTSAWFTYDMTILNFIINGSSVEIDNYIASKCGFSDSSDIKFKVYIVKANEILNTYVQIMSLNEINNIDFRDETQLDEFIEFSSELTKLYEGSIKLKETIM